MYLRRQIASRNHNRISIGSEFTATGHDGREKKQGSQLQQRCGKVCSSCCPRARPSLITVVNNGINSGSYLYDLFQTNAGGRRSATETTQKVIQIDFRQKLVKCFYSERKVIKTRMGLTYKEINHTENAVQKCNRSVHTQENSVTESHDH